MAESETLKHPWLVAAWPGMGNVGAISVSYLMSKLGMRLHSELDVNDIFDVHHVDVSDGIATMGRRPRQLLFTRSDASGQRDLIVFVGEGQPSQGRLTLCRRLLDVAAGLGAEKVITVAAMATQLHPAQSPRVYAAATTADELKQLKDKEVDLLSEGQISGLNGVLLAAASERGLPAMCLLGEIPFFAGHLPNPAAARAVLQVVSTLADIRIDMTELDQGVQTMEKHLLDLLDQHQAAAAESAEGEGFTIPSFAQETEKPAGQDNIDLNLEQRQRIESLFQKAQDDRARAFELKTELDRLGVFKMYEDRFLDLFKRAD